MKDTQKLPPYESAWDLKSAPRCVDVTLWQPPDYFETGTTSFVAFRDAIAITRWLMYNRREHAIPCLWVRAYGVKVGDEIEKCNTLAEAKAHLEGLRSTGAAVELVTTENVIHEGLDATSCDIVIDYPDSPEEVVWLHWQNLDGVRITIDARHVHGVYIIYSQLESGRKHDARNE